MGDPDTPREAASPRCLPRWNRGFSLVSFGSRKREKSENMGDPEPPGKRPAHLASCWDWCSFSLWEKVRMRALLTSGVFVPSWPVSWPVFKRGTSPRATPVANSQAVAIR